MEDIVTFLLQPSVLGYVAIIVVIGLAWLSNKKPKYDKYIGLIYHAANWAEKYIPDDHPDERLSKLDVFLQMFVTEYRKKFGVEPSEADKDAAVTKVEELVWKRNSVKDLKGA